MFLAEQTAAVAAVPAIYKSLSGTNAWWALTPEILVGFLSLVALVDGMLLKKREAWLTPAMIKFFLLLIAGLSYATLFRGNYIDEPLFGGLIRQHTWFTDVARLFFLTTAFCVTHLITVYLRASRLAHHEYYHLTLVATAAMMLLVQANHFVLFFMALETVAVTMYVLVGYNRNSPASLEAGVKYLVSGALSSALLLAGIVLLYGLGGSSLNPNAASQDMLRFDHLSQFIENTYQSSLLVQAGAILVLGGVAFKIGAFPFNVWIPDVYQGAPSPTAAFLATGSKAAGVFSLVLLTAVEGAPFAGMKDSVVKILIPVTALTLLVGNIPALGQLNVKRLMGLSGISHAGFLLMGVIAAITAETDSAHHLALVAIVTYLFTYLFASTLVFAVITHVAGEDDAGSTVTDYKGLYLRNRLVAYLFAIGVGSLAGIPPTLGFVAKLLILIAAFKAGLFGLLAVAFVCLVMSMYYYLGWLREGFHRLTTETEPKPIVVGIRSRIILTVISITLLLGFAAQFVFKF